MAHRAGREPLTRERILRAALRLVDEEGMGALSMRRLAAELGVDPMAIYHHLPGKATILSGLVEDVFAEMRVPPAGGAWRDRVREWAQAYRDLARAHPNLVLHLVSNAEAGVAAALGASESLYEVLEESGLPPRTIVRVADLIVDYANGFALAEVSGPLGQPGDRRELLAQLKAEPAERFPAMLRVFGSLAEGEMGADFEFGLDVILAGLEVASSNAGKSTNKPQ